MTADELKERIDLHELAQRLGWERPGKSRGNYKSPHRKDKHPSVSIFNSRNGGGMRWKDQTSGESGSAIDMVMYHEGCDAAEAITRLHEIFGFEREQKATEAPREESWPEVLARRCKPNAEMAIDYLTGRGISHEVIEAAIQSGSIGFNTWCNDKVQEGEFGYGGPAVAFMCKSLNPGRVLAMEFRYLDPEKNGGVKTQTQGEKIGVGWSSDTRRLMKAHTIVACESPINSLSVETANLPGVAAYAVRGRYPETHDWKYITTHGRSKPASVLICMDNDPINERGERPGPDAAWQLYDLLTAQGIAAHLVNQVEWEHNDINDILKSDGADELGRALRNRFQWIIPGVYGEEKLAPSRRDELGPPRVFLPPHDFAKYWMFRCKEDFTTYVSGSEENDEGDKIPQFQDLCGFRVAAIQRVQIAGSKSVLAGDSDDIPSTMFAVNCQSGFHGNRLQREVFDAKQVHNIDRWKSFGPIFAPAKFMRMVQILGRSAHLGEQSAANFVGLCWKHGTLAVNEGPDTYFTDPKQQCPYSSLVFPTGPRSDAARVIAAYQATYKDNAAMLVLAWALGGHLKCLLGFWPHMVMQADKGAGKSTLIKKLESSIAMTMFSGESMATPFRILTSVSGTSHPVGWEEISARKKDIIDKALAMLQECYQHSVTRRGADLLEFLACAPVLLAGEDAPVKTLLGKVVSTDLTGRKGTMIPADTPRFPVRQWLDWLAEQRPDQIRRLYDSMKNRCLDASMAKSSDTGAERMCENYAAVLTSWRLLAAFAEIDKEQGDFETALIARMNRAIADTAADREPFVWILEKIFLEIEAGRYRYPVDWQDQEHDGTTMACICIRPSQMMHHIEHSHEMRDFFNALPVKSHVVLKRQLNRAGLIVNDRASCYRKGQRTNGLCALSIEGLEQLGLQPPMEPKHEPFRQPGEGKQDVPPYDEFDE